MDDLSAAYEKLKRFSEAKQSFLLAIHTYELQQAPLLPQYAVCLHHYANLLREMQDFANAEQVEARAMRVDVQGVLSAQKNAAVSGFR